MTNVIAITPTKKKPAPRKKPQLATVTSLCDVYQKVEKNTIITEMLDILKTTHDTLLEVVKQTDKQYLTKKLARQALRELVDMAGKVPFFWPKKYGSPEQRLSIKICQNPGDCLELMDILHSFLDDNALVFSRQVPPNPQKRAPITKEESADYEYYLTTVDNDILRIIDFYEKSQEELFGTVDEKTKRILDKHQLSQ